MTWLVTGGAGYIGGHVVRALRASGREVVVLDDLSTGLAHRVDVPLVAGSVLDGPLVARTLTGHAVSGVVHLAARKQVGESVERPLHYYRENVGGLVSLLEACTAAGVASFLFSSSASVYGNPADELVAEDASCAPESPYGQTKLVGEWLAQAAAVAGGPRTTALRYFNVAGSAATGLADTGVFNLIPLVFQALTSGRRPQVFGDDYPTPDGTCIRDYVHVEDLADAHVAAAAALEQGSSGEVYNIGRGQGASVLEVLRVVGEVTGLDPAAEVVGRRPGDPARVVAAVDRAAAGLGFRATRDLRDMVTSAWAGWLR